MKGGLLLADLRVAYPEYDWHDWSDEEGPRFIDPSNMVMVQSEHGGHYWSAGRIKNHRPRVWAGRVWHAPTMLETLALMVCEEVMDA